MKRFAAIVVLVMSTASGAAALDAGEQTGDLLATFHSRGVAFDVVLGIDGAAGVAQPATTPEGYIIPFGLPGQTFCDDSVVGTWVSVFNEMPDVITGKDWPDEIGVTFMLDGEVLETVRTSTRAFVPVAGDQPYDGFSEGAPVLGTLEQGPHTLFLEVDLAPINLVVSWTTEFTVADCG